MYFRCDYDALRRKKEQLKGKNKGGRMDYRMGDAVEVVDGEACWSAKILEIKDESAHVHFLKFNARHDEWIPLERIRRKEEYPIGSLEQKEFKVGERVMAPWKYGRKYPGVVIERQTNGYKVKFYDGVTVSVKPSTMRYLRKDEAPSDEEDDEEEESHTSSLGRRERKSKFNIKDLLSVRRRRTRKSSGVNDESLAGDEEETSLHEDVNVDDEISFKIKTKPVPKKGAKEPEEIKSAKINISSKSLKESGSDELKVKKPPKKVELSAEEKHKTLESKVINKLSRKSLKSFNKSSKFHKKQAVSSSVKKETKNSADSSSTSSSKSSKSSSSSALSSKSKEELLISSKSSKKNSRKPENSLKSSKSSDNNPKKDHVSKKNSRLSLRKNEDKSHSKGSLKTTSSSSKKVNDSEKENSKNSQCKKSDSKYSSGSSKDSISTPSSSPTFNKSSIEEVEKDIKNVKEESKSKKGCKRDEIPASELKDKDITNHNSTQEERPPEEKNRNIKDNYMQEKKSEKELSDSNMKDHNKQEKKSEKELSDSNIKDNESTETICPVKSSSEKETPDNKVKEAAPSEESNSIDSEPVDKKEGTKKINGSTPVIKARITEPLLKEGPPIALVTGKRERKRKKFWDEEDDTLSYAPPPKSFKKSGEISNRRSSSSNNLSSGGTENTCVKNVSKSSSSSRTIKGRFKTEADVRRGNGKKLEYLLFDMNLEPNLIAKQMVEGYNIPGPGEPIPVDSSNLPDGWEKRVIQRGLGVTRGKWDVFIQNASGKSFRSKTELQKHFDENHLNYSIDSFDFSLDDNLKRLRQIWKQFVIKPNLKPGEKLSSPVPAKLSRKALNAKHLKDSSIPSPLSAANQHLPSYLPRVQSASTNSKLKDNGELSNINSRIPSPSGHDYVHHNSLPDTSLSPGVMSETGQGLRCKINNCGKLFRNDKLLLMHVKHYHPEFRDNFPSISCVPSTDGIEEDEGFSPALGGSKRKSEASSFPVSAPPEKKLKTLLPELDRRKTLSSNHDSNLSSGRKRNDSSLSVGSGCTTDGERAVSPTPPKFKSNHRKQFQLLSSKKCTFITEEDGRTQDDSNSEMDASTTSADHLTSEEVVNCTCRRLEEDGLMIQCDLCLCWQHGACLGIFDEDQVPEKHICSICKNPPGSRHPSSRTQIDQDLLKEGKFAVIPSTSSSVSSNQSNLTSKQDAFRKLSDLMADLIGLSKILHSLRIKISVASQKNSSKVFMWSSAWIAPHQPPSKSQNEEGLIEKNNKPCNIGETTSNQENMIIVESLTDPISTIGNDGDSLVGEINGFKEGDPIDPSMIPSVSEVQQLLPSIIEAEGLLTGSQGVDFVTDPPTPTPIMPTIIPEPKRIDKDESRINLIQHIDDVQCEVEERLNLLEENLVRLEKDDSNSESTIDDAVNADCAKTKAIIQMLLMDLSTGKTMLGSI
ncbi:uncharacterized protein [Lepeophtheirus salmonis]|uniref:uncharacterized protein n=1 Tax=Lepeophtheirus salmonis TaxID=72036 RepID=UPI001AE14C40|nr:PHD finger protein 20-like [Lepeophtheirus salmonis]XP_040573439.1 PHD finger protein 20-like [Lepeophtheirus salmonis]XP_040573445.1 PHD finger protein 20-like [Lepeophtheirus salmonis]